MSSGKGFLAGILIAASLAAASAAFADGEFQLFDKRKAVVEKGKLILIGRSGDRKAAPPGRYDTRDGRYTIFVREDGIQVRDRTKELQ
ncbi:MAG: hypothetical protein AB1346_05025 [Thermodesulfobacteriota bacterium]